MYQCSSLCSIPQILKYEDCNTTESRKIWGFMRVCECYPKIRWAGPFNSIFKTGKYVQAVVIPELKETHSISEGLYYHGHGTSPMMLMVEGEECSYLEEGWFSRSLTMECFGAGFIQRRAYMVETLGMKVNTLELNNGTTKKTPQKNSKFLWLLTSSSLPLSWFSSWGGSCHPLYWFTIVRLIEKWPYPPSFRPTEQ